jgi:hypothetical protein
MLERNCCGPNHSESYDDAWEGRLEGFERCTENKTSLLGSKSDFFQVKGGHHTTAAPLSLQQLKITTGSVTEVRR